MISGSILHLGMMGSFLPMPTHWQGNLQLLKIGRDPGNGQCQLLGSCSEMWVGGSWKILKKLSYCIDSA